jgi:hypothetical protein
MLVAPTQPFSPGFVDIHTSYSDDPAKTHRFCTHFYKNIQLSAGRQQPWSIRRRYAQLFAHPTACLLLMKSFLVYFSHSSLAQPS